jgi:hypothetical protein
LGADAHVQRERVPGRRRPHGMDVHAVDADDGTAGGVCAGLRARVDRVPRGRPQRLHGQRAVHELVRHLLYRDQGMPGWLQRHEHVLPNGLHGGYTDHVRELVAVGRLFTRHGMLRNAAGMHLACGARDGARVPGAVREHAANRAVGAWRDVSGLGLAADRAVPVVLVGESAEHNACLSGRRKPAGRNLGPWGRVSGLDLQRWHVPAAARAHSLPVLQRPREYLVHVHCRTTAHGWSARPGGRERHRQRRR